MDDFDDGFYKSVKELREDLKRKREKETENGNSKINTVRNFGDMAES